MVVGAFPAAKLGALLLKQISKPIANIVKTQAKSSPVFRKYVCMPPAQFYNWCEVKAKMWILNLGKPVNIPVLSEAMAIELGANLLGEGIIFIIAAGILISEYNRSSRKEAAKEEAKEKEMHELRSNIQELFIQAEQQSAQLRELTRQLGYLDTKLGLAASSPKPPSPSLPMPKQTKEPSSSPPTIQPLQNMTVHPRTDDSTVGRGLILRAVNEIEHQFWEYPLVEREESLLVLSLYHIQKLLRF